MLGLGIWAEATPLVGLAVRAAMALGLSERGAPLQELFAGDRIPFWLQRLDDHLERQVLMREGAKTGADAIGGLAHYILIVSAAGLVVLLASAAIAMTIGRCNPGNFVRAMLPVFAVAISTQSSLASLPAMLGASRRLGVRESTSDFVLPLAVAIFRATSPAMNMGVAIYAAHLTGTPLSFWALGAGVLVAFLVSLSSVSLPGTLSFVVSVGPIAMAMGNRALDLLESSPRSTSRLISSPTRKKNMAINPSLIQCSTLLSRNGPPSFGPTKPMVKFTPFNRKL